MGRPRKLNTIKILDSIAYIKCKHGDVLIDIDDLPNVCNYTWFTKKAVNNSYYVYCSITENKKDKKLLLSRLLMNPPKTMVVDHIDGNSLDNRRSNLRICTKGENNRNAKKNKRGLVKYKGVGIRKSGRYYAQIQFNGINHCLGTYDTPEEAAKIYNKYALRYFGVYARINNIGESKNE